MYRIIDEISTARGMTYVRVRFWNDQADHDARPTQPRIVKDFLMQLVSTASRIVTNEDGWYKRLSDGVFIDPSTLEPGDLTVWEKEAVSRPVAEEIEANLEAYYDRATARTETGDRTSVRSNERTQDDPRGILARQDVQDLVGTGRERVAGGGGGR